MQFGAVLALSALFTTLFLVTASETTISASKDSYSGARASVSVQKAGALRAGYETRKRGVAGGGEIAIADAGALQSPISSIEHSREQSQDRRSGTVSFYVVREADSLSEIAEMFDVSVNTLVWANDIEDRTIHPGQTLLVLPMTGVRHEVEEGDTLNSIVEKYDADIEEVRRFNEMDEDARLAVGDVVDIPHGEKGSTVSSAQTSASSQTHTSPRPGHSASSGSSWLILPINGTKTQHTHGYNAVDYGAPVGTPVVASAGGTIIVAKNSGWNGGYGSYVVVEHSNGVQTLYAHLNSVLTSVGRGVVQGEMIATSGSSGRSTGPHLHYEVRGAVNPF